MSGTSFSVALIHHPVYDKNRQVVTTAVTNLDIHDIARAARTFGADRYYIVTPVTEQQAMVSRIVSHWQDGWGATYNPKRKAALDLVTVAPSLEAVRQEMTRRFGQEPKIVVTGATGRHGSVTTAQLAPRIAAGGDNYLLLFGTGWGMTEEIFAAADLVLEPIAGCGDYNHLSVRSAVSIYMDRLFGRR
ncbi:MAG TPA: RNA methyltransferase [Geobacteraceae bacterium]|nr:RNA methyltransferase [Geobacteraceae bacterium]